MSIEEKMIKLTTILEEHGEEIKVSDPTLYRTLKEEIGRLYMKIQKEQKNKPKIDSVQIKQNVIEDSDSDDSNVEEKDNQEEKEEITPKKFKDSIKKLSDSVQDANTEKPKKSNKKLSFEIKETPEGKPKETCNICGGIYTHKNRFLHVRSKKHCVAEAKANGTFNYTDHCIIEPKTL
jgi:hypothetical protein